MQNLISVDELADRLSVPKSWIYSQTRKRGEKTIPCVRIGKYCRFNYADVLEWLKSKSQGD